MVCQPAGNNALAVLAARSDPPLTAGLVSLTKQLFMLNKTQGHCEPFGSVAVVPQRSSEYKALLLLLGSVKQVFGFM